jgi:hypothetical protein
LAYRAAGLACRGGRSHASIGRSIVDAKTAVLLAELASLRSFPDLILVTDNKGVGALVDANHDDRQSLIMLDLTLLPSAVIIAQLDTFGKQLIPALDALHHRTTFLTTVPG